MEKVKKRKREDNIPGGASKEKGHYMEQRKDIEKTAKRQCGGGEGSAPELADVSSQHAGSCLMSRSAGMHAGAVHPFPDRRKKEKMGLAVSGNGLV